VPASSANLGPGFDVLAIALDLHIEVSVEEASSLEVVTTGEGSGLPADASHLAARVASEVAGHDRLRIEVQSDIPLGRGLGSSAALAVAAAAAAGADDPFAWGVRIDGHPENAAASTFGGLVGATTGDGRAVWRHLPLDPDLTFVAVVPERELLTAEARRVLTERVDRADALFNLGRMALLVAGLADAATLIPEAGDDRLHQDRRAVLFPESTEILAGLRRAGALTSFWSGAGTTLLAVTRRAAAEALVGEAERIIRGVGVSGRILRLEADRRGITLLR
jgi:homoserine kinase